MPYTHDVIVIGAGAAGLTAAGGLARLGLKVALIERDAMGGECLNTGCVPSKALLAAANRAQAVRQAGQLGIRSGEPQVDFAAVRAHVQAAIAMIAPHDSEERFAAWGVEVIRGAARFVGDRRVSVNGRALAAPRVVLAVGSKPRVPQIPGLAELPYLTNETLFDLAELPKRLLVLGAGPIGAEMAQAFRRLGAEVVVIARGRPLSKDEPDAADIIRARLAAEGVEFRLDAKVTRAADREGSIKLILETGEELTGSHLLVATGRVVEVQQLDLPAAGVKSEPTGIIVDQRRRTSARGVYAIGDCRQGPRFTHAAGYEGTRTVIEIGFGLPAPVAYAGLPHVTYTDPELAQIGMTEAEARAAGGRIEILHELFADNDRAVTEARTDGFIKVVRRNGRVVGACIVGAGAADLAGPWVLAICRSRGSLWTLSGAILPYPTRSEISKAVAFSAFERFIFSQWARTWARLLAVLRRRAG